MIDDPSRFLGKRLRSLRKSRGLTLRQLADASGLSINTISLIERRKISPTVATLSKLAGALDIMAADFLSGESDERVIFLKKGQRRRVRNTQSLIESLGKGLTNQIIEPLLVTLEAGASSGTEPMAHLGQELVYCLEGHILYEVGDRDYTMTSGDSLLFEAYQPHRWYNRADNRSRMLLIIQTPGGEQSPLH